MTLEKDKENPFNAHDIDECVAMYSEKHCISKDDVGIIYPGLTHRYYVIKSDNLSIQQIIDKMHFPVSYTRRECIDEMEKQFPSDSFWETERYDFGILVNNEVEL